MDSAARAGEECCIRRLLAEYCHLSDSHRPDEWTALFTEDAQFIQTSPTPFGPAVCRGREEIRSHMTNRPEDWIPLHHFTCNSVIVMDPDGETARAWSYFFVVKKSADSSKISVGLYTDELVRNPDRWRFRSRVVSLADSVPEDMLFANRS